MHSRAHSEHAVSQTCDEGEWKPADPWALGWNSP